MEVEGDGEEHGRWIVRESPIVTVLVRVYSPEVSHDNGVGI